MRNFMSNFIYQTPDKKYRIRTHDTLWHEIFGDDIEEYLICKYDAQLDKPGFSGYFIFRSEQSLKDAFGWLLKKGKITKEEMKLHESLWGVALDTQKKAW
jgi:hypothetical protein